MTFTWILVNNKIMQSNRKIAITLRPKANKPYCNSPTKRRLSVMSEKSKFSSEPTTPKHFLKTFLFC